VIQKPRLAVLLVLLERNSKRIGNVYSLSIVLPEEHPHHAFGGVARDGARVVVCDREKDERVDNDGRARQGRELESSYQVSKPKLADPSSQTCSVVLATMAGLCNLLTPRVKRTRTVFVFVVQRHLRGWATSKVLSFRFSKVIPVMCLFLMYYQRVPISGSRNGGSC
jgi:hypothetical protein